MVDSRFYGRKEETVLAHFNLRIDKGKRGTAAQSCRYIDRTDPNHITKEKKKELIYSETLNLPCWAKNAEDFFSAADYYERQNGTACIKAIIALPCELNHEENINLAQKIAREFVGTTKPGLFVIHSKKAFSENVEQIHMHLIFSIRDMTDSQDRAKDRAQFFKRANSNNPSKGGYAKDENFNGNVLIVNKKIKALREKTAELINDAYKNAGLEITVSAKKIEDQYKEALENNDNDLAEFLKRAPRTRIKQSAFYMITNKIKKEGFFNDSLSLNLNILTDQKEKLTELKDKDFVAFRYIVETMNLKMMKLIFAQKCIKAKQQAKNLALKDIRQTRFAIEAKLNELEIKTLRNKKRIVLYNSIFGNRNKTINLMKDFASGCLYKRKSRLVQQIETLKAQQKELFTKHHMTDKLVDALKTLEKKEIKQTEKLKEVQRQIDNYKELGPRNKRRLQYAIDRANRTQPVMYNKALDAENDNKIYKMQTELLEELRRTVSLIQPTNLLSKELSEKLNTALKEPGRENIIPTIRMLKNEFNLSEKQKTQEKNTGRQKQNHQDSIEI